MKASNAQLDGMGLERGRRLVLHAFSPDHQRMRSAGSELTGVPRTAERPTRVIKEGDTKERVSTGGFNPRRCHASAQRHPRYSQPVMGGIENESAALILGEIRNLPAHYQWWLHFQYKQVHNPEFHRKLQIVLFAMYKKQCGPINAETIQIAEVMIREHLRYLSGMDTPPGTHPSRRDAAHEIRSISDTSWKRTHNRHWKESYQMILGVDASALTRLGDKL